MRTFQIETLGCKVNQYETMAMEELLLAHGYLRAEKGAPADVCIVNTCTVTHASDRKSRQWMHRMKRENPEAVIVVAGCYAQVAHEKLKEMPEVDLLIGTADKQELPKRLEEWFAGTTRDEVRDFASRETFAPFAVTEAHERTRATVKVQDGCNQFCSYCIIPYARGPIRSRSLKDMVAELERMVHNGYKEAVLTGIHLASWGKESGEGTLIDAIRAAHGVEGMERIRLSSLEPGIVTEEFARALAELPKMCDHFHLSLQSGSDAVLARMRRRYTSAEYLAALDTLRSVYPNAGFTTDVIAGFPGETDGEWRETVDTVRRAGFSRLHVFPYSPREGTPAAEMDGQVDPRIKKERTAELIAVGQELTAAFLESQIGRTVSVLTEEPSKEGGMIGYATNYAEVLVEDATVANAIVRVRIEGREAERLIGKME